MTRQELVDQLSKFIEENGSEKSALLISDAIDGYRPKDNVSIHYMHKAIIETLQSTPAFRNH